MKNFLYILTHSSGNLTTEFNPINWANLNTVFRRSDKYHSVLRSQILDVEFPFDGKAYIDTIYNTFGIDTEIGCEIQYLDKSDFTYATLYTGIIDLSEWKSLRDTTLVKIIDSSVMAKFQTRDKVKIPINKTEDIDGDAVAVYTYLADMTVEGVNLEEQALFDFSVNQIQISSAETTNFTDYRGVINLDFPFNEIGDDATLPDVILGSADGPIYTNNGASTVTLRYRVVGQIEGSVEVTSTSGQPWSWAAEMWFGITEAKVIDINDNGSGNKTTNFDTPFDSGLLTNTISAGNTLDVFHVWTGAFNGVGDTIDPNFRFKPTFIQIFEVIPAADATVVEMPLLHELGAKLLEIITGVSNPLNAPLLGRTDSEPRTYGGDGSYSLNGVASGFMLRGYDFEDQPLSVKFEDYFKSIDALFNLGFWYDGTEFSIAAKADFYKVSNIITLGEVQDLEIGVARDHYFNKVLTGYQKQLDFEEVNGVQSFCVRGDMINDGKRIESDLNLQSVIRGDDYGIELSRQKPFNTEAAEDSRFDNDAFFVTGQRDGGDYITLQGLDDFTVLTGLYAPSTRLNLNITPKRNLLRHLNQLSIPGFISNGDLSFLSNQYNLALETTKSGDPVVEELTGVDFADMDEPLYYPETYNFTSQLTVAHILQLQSDPHGYIDFDYLGVTYSGYILEVSAEPFNRRGNWTLIKRNPNR